MTNIGDVMKENVVTVDENSTVETACKIMGERHIGSVVVTHKDKPYGIFTERDLLSKVITKGADIKKAKVKDFTSEPIVTINPDFNIREAARIMADLKIKRLLVMKDEKIIGIFTAADLADFIARSSLEL
ncbi:MAG: CBS domain-containing protein [Methanocellales archaeon]|nr:CBS domain-containing protein [Methanocellales archaeon]